MAPALRSLLHFNLACFGVSVLAMLAGHRLRKSHSSLSLMSLVAVAVAGLGILAGLGLARPPLPAVLTELLLGLALVLRIRDWNLLGHAVLWSLGMVITTFVLLAVHFTVSASLGPWSLALSAFLLLLHVVSMALLVAHTYEILDATCRFRWRWLVHPRPSPGYTPRVSLHVPAHNEPPEMVKATLSALAALDYPNFEVVMVDDNTTDEALWRPVEQHCRKLGFKFFHLKNWPGYKAGALNFALTRTDPAAEIVAVVDSDYLVEPGFLRDLVGLFQDPEVAFVQTPQDYRDFRGTDRYARACYDAYQYFFRISMAWRNEHNAIIHAGTMGLVRRQVLEEVGGWDEWCLTEDAELSLRLLHAGHRGIYVDRTYGRGLMPLDYGGLRRQRFRWAFGGMQLLRLHWRKLLPAWCGGDRGSRLGAMQKFAYLSGALQWLNDPLATVFTVILLVGVGVLAGSGSLLIQPVAGGAIFVPLAFVLFSLLRFVWALRVRARCSLREAWGALTILVGLTWVVTAACAQGLIRRHGVFHRTPKSRATAGPLAGLATVRTEVGLSALCGLGPVAVLVADLPLSLKVLLVALLMWQLFVYASSVWSWRWSRQRSALWEPVPAAVPFNVARRRIAVAAGSVRPDLGNDAAAREAPTRATLEPSVHRIWRSARRLREGRP